MTAAGAHNTGLTPTSGAAPGAPVSRDQGVETECLTETGMLAAYEPLAVLATTNPALAAAVTAIDPRVQIVDPGLGDPATGQLCVLASRSGLLLLVPGFGADVLAALADARKLLLTDDLDDATVWAQAVDWRAGHVAVLPDGAAWLATTIREHLTTHPAER
jgi:hypothetical protein